MKTEDFRAGTCWLRAYPLLPLSQYLLPQPRSAAFHEHRRSHQGGEGILLQALEPGQRDARNKEMTTR